MSTDSRAKELRRLSTDAERRLWSALRVRRLEDFKFRRQAPIDSYIVDFVCFDARLIVEVDGAQHRDSKLYDEMRTNRFEFSGFRVLRFWNNDVLTNLDGVLETIRSHLK